MNRSQRMKTMKKPTVSDKRSIKMEKGQRWTAPRKAEVVLRLLRGEAVEDLSREIGVESYRLEEWKRQGLDGLTISLKARDNDPLQEELDRAKKQIGELSMEVELLKTRCRKRGPLVWERS